jgi:DNA-binding response OmpR family regulator
MLDGKRVQLTRKEYALLHALAAHAGLVVTHQQLIKEIWGGHAGNTFSTCASSCANYGKRSKLIRHIRC